MVKGGQQEEEDMAVSASTVAGWGEWLEEVIQRIGPHFARIDAVQWAWVYLQGLFSEVPRKNGWQLAEQAGKANPFGIQDLLGRMSWSEDLVRDELRAYTVEQLADAWTVGVFDETGILKKGEHSVGVQRQYCGTTGQVENCQVGVFLGYATAKGHALIDRRLYLPEGWAADAARRQKAHVPEEVTFQTKPQLAIRMWEAACAAGVGFSWMTGDEVYGRDPVLRHQLEHHRQAYILTIPCDHRLKLHFLAPEAQEVAAIAAGWGATMWHRLSAGDGSKGPRLYDWAFLPVGSIHKGWQHGLLVRRSLTDPTDLAYHLTYSPVDTPLDELVRVAGARWTVEENFERAKDDVGLDHYEVRSWHGWHRHITLAMWALAFLTVTCRRANDEAGATPEAKATDLAALKAALQPQPPADTSGDDDAPKKKMRPRPMATFLRQRGLSCG